MASVKWYLDSRKYSGESPMFLVFRNKNTTSSIKTRFSLYPEHWDGQKVIIRKDKVKVNAEMNYYMSKVQLAMEDVCGLRTNLKASMIRDRVIAILDKGKPQANRLLELFVKHVGSRDRPLKTVESYHITAQKIKQLDKRSGDLLVDDIDEDWLFNFDAWMERAGLSINTRAIHLENLRAVINYANRQGYSNNDVFKLYKIRRVQAPKRSLSVETLHDIFTFKGCNKYEQYYLDIFKLMVMMCGINLIDLYNLTEKNIHNGRIEFVREKTKKHGILVSLPILPEMQEIFDRYKVADGYLLNIHYLYKSHASFLSKINKRLKLIGEVTHRGHYIDRVPKWPYLSTYYSRHSAATLLSQLGAPIDIIASGMGHSLQGMTHRYITASMSELDYYIRFMVDVIKEGSLPNRRNFNPEQMQLLLRMMQ